MDPGHHAAFLLAILICILLLLLAVSAFLLYYWREKCFNIKNGRSSQMLRRLQKDQATSMTSFTLNTVNPKSLIYNEHQTLMSGKYLPVMVDQGCQNIPMSSCLSLESHILDMNEDDGSQTRYASDLVNASIVGKSETEKMSTMNFILSSGASILGSILEKSSIFSLKSKQLSSSMKSGLDPDILMVPMESPVHGTSSVNVPFRATSLPRELSHSVLLCENSNDQQFTWNTELSALNSHGESVSVPATLERKSHISEENDLNSRNVVPLRKPSFCLQPKAWFVSFGNRPLSVGNQVEPKEINNVTSLDSGVDIMEVPIRQVSGGTERDYGTKQNCRSEDQDTLKTPEKLPVSNQANEENQELQISHQEAARKLNEGSYSRSLWQKREERPLIWVN